MNILYRGKTSGVGDKTLVGMSESLKSLPLLRYIEISFAAFVFGRG